jgi:hypothetical protein
MKKGQAIVSFLVGFSVIFLMALSTDQIIQKVYDSANQAFRVDLVAGGGGGGGGITSGTTACTGSAPGAVMFINGAVIDCANGPVYDSGTSTLTFGGWQLFPVAGTYFQISRTGKLSGFLPFNDDADTQMVANLFDKEGVGAAIAKNASTAAGTGTNNIPSSGAVVSDGTAGFYVIAGQGNLHLGAGNYSTANQSWDVTTTGNFVSVGATRNITASGGISSTPVAVASLGTCDGTTEGQHKAVNNSNATSFTLGIGAIVAAGGTTHVPVYCDGTNWRIG